MGFGLTFLSWVAEKAKETKKKVDFEHSVHVLKHEKLSYFWCYGVSWYPNRNCFKITLVVW